MLADFERTKEERLWFPILRHHGFSGLDLSPDVTDQENAIDAVGFDEYGAQKSFALRSRTIGRYTESALAQYKREFTIRYSRPSGVPVEWQKLFEMDMVVRPDYFCYGWCNRNNTAMDDYIVLDISVLRALYDAGHLNRYVANLRTNVDRLRSTLVFISIPELITLPGGRNVVVYHSENHPGLR